MTENQNKLSVEALLCDIDKVIAKEKLKEINILTQDYTALTKFAKLAVAAAEHQGVGGTLDRNCKLRSVFNRLNKNAENKVYQGRILTARDTIPYPEEPDNTDQELFYEQVEKNLLEFLGSMPKGKPGVNGLLNVLEANLSFVPAGTPDSGLDDISLFDYLKMVAAVACCAQVYLEHHKLEPEWLTETEKRKNEEMFLLYSMDVSGIQKFIYTVSSKGALKGLRARSFYLEMVMEHVIDELLDKLGLSRANLIYAGGGHCYMLLPNTDEARCVIAEQEREVNKWFLKHFGIALFIAGGYSVATVNSLANVPDGSYGEMYRNIAQQIGNKKFCRYDASVINALNDYAKAGTRECEVCLRTDCVDDDGRCPICAALYDMGGAILKKKNLIVVTNPKGRMLPLPGRGYLTCGDDGELAEWQKSQEFIRCYVKNTFHTENTHLWLGDYTSGDTFEELAKKSQGIKRIAVLRGDVDNLGKTFVSGFEQENGDNSYVTLSRTATLSRQLSLFFKGYINSLLEAGKENRLFGSRQRNIAIVYSGGDDVFLVGAWNDVVETAIDMKNALERYSQGTLSISAGIGLYPVKYPINLMAKETGRLEDVSKKVPGKNAVTLFEEDECYRWTEFENNVLGEKYCALCEFFEKTDDKGNNFLYRLLELLRGREERINKARYVYLLSRMEPGTDAPKEKKQSYKEFSKKMYVWFGQEEDRRALITAIMLYVYVNRDEEEK